MPVDSRYLPAAASLFQLKDPGLYRVATADGQQYIAGYVDHRDRAALPIGALVIGRLTGPNAPLLAGRIVTNALTDSYCRNEESGLTLQLCLPEEVAAEFFPQSRIGTLLLALEQLPSHGF